MFLVELCFYGVCAVRHLPSYEADDDYELLLVISDQNNYNIQCTKAIIHVLSCEDCNECAYDA